MSGERPTVHVQEISQERDMIVAADKPKTPDLGKETIEANVGKILTATRKEQRVVFELTWDGSKIPRGAEILGEKIGWTQNGVVSSENGEIIGTYERIEEWTGSNGDHHKMHVYIDHPGLLDAHGRAKNGKEGAPELFDPRGNKI